MRGQSRHQPFQYRRVKVEAIEPGVGYAVCRDDTEAEIRVPLSFRVGKGGWPRQGEDWVIMLMSQQWVFFCVVADIAPVTIMTPRDSMDAGTEEILDALINLGLVIEEGSDFQRDTT